MIWELCIVAAGGFLGAVCRFMVSLFLSQRCSTSFPYGTLTVNIIGSFALGLLIGANSQEIFVLFIGIGFLGAFTTYSTLSIEMVQILQEKKWLTFVLYTILTYVIGILAAYLGFIINT
jgi:CrcB protein